MEILNSKYDFLAYSRIHISIDLNNILVINHLHFAFVSLKMQLVCAGKQMQ